jgi:PRTRC genetic system protein E
MFKKFYDLVQSGPVTLKMFAGENGTMKVVVTPSAEKSSEIALTQPLVLTATPEEFDNGFIDALCQYEISRSSLASQVAATTAILDTAKKNQSDKAVNALKSKVKTSKLTPSSTFDVGDEVDDENENESDEEAPTKTTSVQKPEKPIGDSDLLNLI